MKLMASKSVELARECKRLSESCLYTSTSFFIWLRVLRTVKTIFIIVPLVLGAVAGGKLLIGGRPETQQTAIAVCAFIAGVLPSIYAALKFDDRLGEDARVAGEFKNLQDRFRTVALVSSKKSFEDFEADVAPLIKRYEAARSVSLTPPEWVFARAQAKVKKGDYTFEVDLEDDAKRAHTIPSE